MVDRYEPDVEYEYDMEGERQYRTEMREHHYGDYVRYEEYQTLKEKYEKLCAKVTEAWWEVP